MATKYKENVRFNDLSKGLGKLSSNRKKMASRAPKSVDTSKYQNISNSLSGMPKTTNSTMSNLGTQTVPYGGSTKYEKFHPGIDTANKIGTPIPSNVAGIVESMVTGKKQGDKGYGNFVIVRDKDGNAHRYSHLHDSYVKVGQKITPGTVLGGMGNSGAAYSNHGGTGSHLDYRIQNAYGKYINPQQYL